MKQINHQHINFNTRKSEGQDTASIPAPELEHCGMYLE